MPNPIYETGNNTRALVEFFITLKLSETSSYERTSKAVGFKVTPQNSASARKIAERDHKAFIAVVPKQGFYRGTHEDMAKSGPSFLLTIRRKSKRLINRMALSLEGNLSESVHMAAREMHTRGSIIHSTSEKIKVMSNRETREEAPVSKHRPGFENIALLRK